MGYLISRLRAGRTYDQLGGNIEIILDGGACSIGVESTIIKFDDEDACILRHGGISLEDIEGLIGRVKIMDNSGTPEAPGQLPYHYSPITPISLIDSSEDFTPLPNSGLLSFLAPAVTRPFKIIEVLSERGDLKEAAERFFTCLHKLDSSGLNIIYAVRVPETGLGRAIMDRLRRASNKSIDNKKNS